MGGGQPTVMLPPGAAEAQLNFQKAAHVVNVALDVVKALAPQRSLSDAEESLRAKACAKLGEYIDTLVVTPD